MNYFRFYHSLYSKIKELPYGEKGHLNNDQYLYLTAPVEKLFREYSGFYDDEQYNEQQSGE